MNIFLMRLKSNTAKNMAVLVGAEHRGQVYRGGGQDKPEQKGHYPALSPICLPFLLKLLFFQVILFSSFSFSFVFTSL